MRFVVGACLCVAVAGVIAIAQAPVHAAGADEQIGNPALGKRPGHAGRGTPLTPEPGHQLAAFAQGCFWGSEERFRRAPGVTATAVGYAGGHTENPSYEDVCGDATGHAETVLVEFDPKVTSYDKLLQYFWDSHDPTSGNAQGPDHGTQYRSVVFTFSPEQHEAALASKTAEQKKLADPITTQIVPMDRFWIAEDYHQQWDEKHGARSCPIPHRPRKK